MPKHGHRHHFCEGLAETGILSPDHANELMPALLVRQIQILSSEAILSFSVRSLLSEI